MNKVLHIVSSWGNGGVERYISNYINEIDEYIFDILSIRATENKSLFTNEIIKNGGQFYSLPKVYGNIFLRVKERNLELKKIIAKSNYKVIHINAGTADAFILAKTIKKVNPEVKVIMHCHGSNVEAPKKFIKRIYHEVCKLLYGSYVDYAIAVSSSTLTWMFKHNVLRKIPYEVFGCGIDINKFQYSDSKRAIVRGKLNIQDEFVIGTIGRFTEQKNPFYIVEIVKEISKLDNNFKFLWIGEGRLFESVRSKVKEYGIEDNFIFYGITENIPNMLSAMDLFILPSCFEGNPIVGVEAQANGLQCIFSDSITREVDVTGRVDFMSIIKQEKEWANRILSYKITYDRDVQKIKDGIRKNGWDMKVNSIKLSNIYKMLMEKK